MSRDARRQESKSRNRIPFIIMLVLLVIVLAVVIVFAIKGKDTGSNAIKDDQTADGPVEKWQEGVITHNGKDYIYNQDIKAYLIMGVDKDGTVEEEAEENYTQGGQSDAMFLLVTDASTKKMSVVSIHRNTMTRIETCSVTGKSLGYMNAQICLQHSFGDGKSLSCVRAADAVSYLFYNLPISGYLAMNMNGMPIMNDSIGGVEVTVLQDLVDQNKGVSLKKGETKTLTGDEAYIYLRRRDITEFDSASDRLKRQEQYITAYMKKLETIASSNPSAAVKIYESLEDYIVSSIDFASLVSEISEYSFDASTDMYSIPGETRQGPDIYEEYHIDEDAFYELVLDVFYKEVTK